ncbi:polyprenol phosphomannose-dependent alpha 1,6 mannosyltransferase MptB [Streptomyces sp. Ru72]|uniref:polyprenol phosphomannose-dependent alpha 1,6 mannosyltransferase MptB n=1 Tax=Streptomyces sp. Ru72 TaxID=2080747 RepID=UPI000CDD63D0|nr:polyprenol phosphomannose-dependent alpha 1,6 mannosyltransferase MptB [Streptomyces sp. Ru72]POX43823.1 DUF2029 domain-containing protein [Streptomyces sp. Ru72]
MAFPVDLRRCQALGLAGTAFLALGGETAGALPVEDLVSPESGRAALGLVGVYFGVVLLIAAWALLGRVLRGPEPPSPRALLLVLATWSAPLLLAPPLFSRDVYSYLAQGAMVHAHLDVYAYGPAQLGGPLADEVAPVWRDTAAPYGPVFLVVASALSGLTRGELPAGLLGMRLVALLGVALMAFALPRLARHCGADPAAALWLGALNPLVLLHLVAGAHNDAIMLGLLGMGLLGTVWSSLSSSRRPARTLAAPAKRPSSAATGAFVRHAGRTHRTPFPLPLGNSQSPAARGRLHVLGVVLVTLAALVKAPAALGLLAVIALRRHVGLLRATVTTTVTALATTAAATAVAGTGYGWIAALKTPVSPHNWSPTSVLGRVTGRLLEGLGSDLAPLAEPAWHAVGVAATAITVLVIWVKLRPSPVYALGLSLAVVAVLGPAVRPWYALWGLFLIAAAAPSTSVRHRVAAATAVLALAVLPSGGPPDLAQVVLAVSGGMLAVVVLWQANQVAQAPVLGRTA